MKRPFTRLLRAATDLILPRYCVHCGHSCNHRNYEFLCKKCAYEIFFAQNPCCTICGYPYLGAIIGPKQCPHCAELNPLFDQGKILFLAQGPGRSLLHELKYRHGFYILRDIASMVLNSSDYTAYINGATLIPVPLHPVKFRERGFNQSQKLATMLAKTCQAKVLNLLRRTKFTQTQTRLNRHLRYQNVKNAFAIATNARVIADDDYILIDDVFTTGSNLNACAQVLRQAGAKSIRVATIGHG